MSALTALTKTNCKVLAVCDFLDGVLDHDDMPGTDFYQCKQIASDIRKKFTPSLAIASRETERVDRDSAIASV